MVFVLRGFFVKGAISKAFAAKSGAGQDNGQGYVAKTLTGYASL